MKDKQIKIYFESPGNRNRLDVTYTTWKERGYNITSHQQGWEGYEVEWDIFVKDNALESIIKSDKTTNLLEYSLRKSLGIKDIKEILKFIIGYFRLTENKLGHEYINTNFRNIFGINKVHITLHDLDNIHNTEDYKNILPTCIEVYNNLKTRRDLGLIEVNLPPITPKITSVEDILRLQTEEVYQEVKPLLPN